MDKAIEYLLHLDPATGLLCVAVMILYLLHRHRIQDYKSSVETQRTVDQTLRDEIGRLQTKTDRVELKYEALEKTNATLQHNLTGLQFEYERLKRELSGALELSEMHKKNLREVLGLVLAQIDENTDSLARLSADIKEMRATPSAAHRVRAELSLRLDEGERQLRSVSVAIGALRKRIET
jgi:chromosome segregation ATPase